MGNPPIFDDVFLFSGQRFLYYATHPFGLELRVPPYFSFAVVQVLSGQMVTHRILSLALHIACSLALYKLLYDLLRAVRRPDLLAPASGTQPEAATWAFIGAAAFAVHPVAVYGAAYLVQRTIVLATLFRSFRSSCSCGGWSAAGTRRRSLRRSRSQSRCFARSTACCCPLWPYWRCLC